jgi:hypothetical protein
MIRFADAEPAKPKREVARAILGKVEAALGVKAVTIPRNHRQVVTRPEVVTLASLVSEESSLTRAAPKRDRAAYMRERRAAAKSAPKAA